MKICIASVSPYVGTGYGVATKNLIKHIIDLGHEVCVCGLYGQSGYIQPYEYAGKVINIYPRNLNIDVLKDLPSIKIIEKYDLVITIYDIFALSPRYMNDYIISFLMLDSEPFLVTNIPSYNRVNYALGMTKYATELLEEYTSKDQKLREYFLPVNEEDFKLYDKEESIEFVKKNLDIKGNINKFFVVNAANVMDGGVERKNFAEIIKWWSEYTKNNEEDYLYLHTDITGEGQRGVVIESLIALYDCKVSNIRFARPTLYTFGMYDNDYLSRIYSAGDYLVLPSHSEGFGYPIVEAAMCGCLPLVNNFGSGAEVCKRVGGDLIDCQDNYYTRGSKKSISFAKDIDKAVDKVKKKLINRYKLRELAIKNYGNEVSRIYLDKILNEAIEHKFELNREIKTIK